MASQITHLHAQVLESLSMFFHSGALILIAHFQIGFDEKVEKF
jgi:hypothetical protein